jgi:HAE1 family hydrophobic/amphiphilic exporter-1
MWLTRISIRNPYLATVLMLALVLLGLVAVKDLSVEEFPDIKFPVAVVTTTYKGASPEIVETDISKPIEEALNTLNGIKTIRSYSFDGSSTVVAEFNLNVNPDVAIQDVRDKVSAVSAGFRKEISNPLVSKVDMKEQPMMSLIISANNMSLRDLTEWVEQVAKKKLQTVAGVGDVKLVGGVARQIRVNVEPYKLQSLGLSISDVSHAIEVANDNYPAGDIQTTTKKINVRINGKLKTPLDFANIVIAYRNDVPIRLSDVATVEDGHEEYNSLTLVNGQRAVGLDLRPADKANVVDVANGVYKVITLLNQTKPAGVNILTSYDRSVQIKQSLSDVEHTLFEGAVLTILIVFLFLKSWRSTVITGLTLPIALIGTLFAIWAFDFTLNMMSLMALSLSIGLLIDDAIVVRENIVRHLHMGKTHLQAALDGTNEIGLAVLATTLTIIAVFLPVGFMQGIIGKFFFQFGITVTVAVVISLLVSFTLDPMLSSIWHEPSDGGWVARSWLGRILDKFETGFDKIINKYEWFIRKSLNYRKTTLIISLVILVGSFMLVPLIGGEFIPDADKGKYTVTFKTSVGSNIFYTENKVNQISKLLQQNIPQIKSITGGVNKNFGDGENNATLTIDVGSKNQRNLSLKQIMQRTRRILEQVGGIKIQTVMSLGSPNGDQKPINVEIQGENIQRLQQISQQVLEQIAKIKGVTDLETSYQTADPALNIHVNRDLASNLGINLADIGNTISTLFAGNKVSTWEDPLNGDNYDVVLQIPEEERNKDILNLLQVPSSTLDNDTGAPQMVALANLATTKSGLSPREIDRVNLQRNVSITGNIDGRDNQHVFSNIQKIISKFNLPAGYKLKQSGDSEDMAQSFMYAVSALMIGVAFIYMILTAQFKSFIKPLVIMVALPLSFVGVFIALLVCGSTLNMFSIIGIIMLMGLATKNGILLVDFINQQINEGVVAVEAIVNAGKTRLRPIIMTSLAMIFGMLPLALSNGEGTEVRKPMAYAIIGGMVTSTLLTLVVVPVLYSFLIKANKLRQGQAYARTN